MRHVITLVVCFVTLPAFAEELPKPIVGTAANFASYTEAEDPVIVKFGADWCPGCVKGIPAADAYAADGRIILTVDADTQQPLLKTHGVTSLPTYIVFHHGKPIYRKNAPILTASGLKLFLREALARQTSLQ